jgi:ABC-2 type transport system permease protein
MVNWKSKKLGDYLTLANGLMLVVLLNLLGSFYFFRVDLTEEKRYSVKPSTLQLLKNLEEPVYIEVFLEGDLNAGFRRFQKSIRETLEEFRVYSDGKVQYTFTNPSAAIGQKAQSEFMNELASKGIQVLPVIENKDGQRTEKLVFPGALVSSGGIETGVMLFKGNRTQGSQEVLNQSIEGVEYELANAIHKLVNTNRKKIAFSSGHGELDSLQLASLKTALSDQYDLETISTANSIKDFSVIIVAKPTRSFSEKDKYELDQFVMRGGRVLFLLDQLDAKMDSASSENHFAFPYELKLDDQLFKYGVRINQDLIQDRVSSKYPVVVGSAGNKPQMMQMDWPFFPLINNYTSHPITQNMDAVLTRFVSSIDTVKAVGIKKTPLLFSSVYSRKVNSPVQVSINDLRKNVDPSKFNGGAIPVGYLLEGKFSSLYKNRFLPEGADQTNFKDEGVSKIIVISDGDLARNDINPRNNQPQQLGRDPFSNYTFANQELLLNMVAYLTDENGLINARSKEIKIRPLDKEKIRQSKSYWQIINLVAPLVLLVVLGLARTFWRKRKYAAF